MKAVILSDIHLGRYKYGKMDVELGIDTRTQDILQNIDQTIDYAIEEKADMIIMTGDFYHIKKPDQTFRRLLTKRIERMIHCGFDVYMMLGNHDQGRTKGHDLVELVELSAQIPKLHVIEKEENYLLASKDTLLCFFPFINRIEMNIKREDFHDYQIKRIKAIQQKAFVSDVKNKLFFGHFGTDASKIGNSMDLGQLSQGKTIPLSIFDKKVWTKVYLGDIHKHQEMNEFCRHMGSIAKVDFGEEGESKGFYFYEDGEDKFVEIEDRNFMTFEDDFVDDPERINAMFPVIAVDPLIQESITRLKLRVKSIDMKLLDIDSLEKVLRERSWHYVGKSITQVYEEDNTELSVKEMAELDHMDIFKKYLESQKEDHKKEVFDIMVEEGKQILDEVLNVEVK